MITLLSEAARMLAPAVLWTKNKGFTFNSRLNRFDQVEKILWVPMPKTTSVTQLLEQLTLNETKEVYFCISLLSANLFFAANLKDHDKTGLFFDVPKTLH